MRQIPRKSNKLHLELKKNSSLGVFVPDELLFRLFVRVLPSPAWLCSRISRETLHNWFPWESPTAKGDCAPTCPRQTPCPTPLQVSSWVSPFLRVLSSGFQGDSWIVGCINPGNGTVRAQATCRFAGIILVSNILPLSTRGLLFVRQSVLIPDNKTMSRGGR